MPPKLPIVSAKAAKSCVREKPSFSELKMPGSAVKKTRGVIRGFQRRKEGGAGNTKIASGMNRPRVTWSITTLSTQPQYLGCLFTTQILMCTSVCYCSGKRAITP